MQKIAPKNSTNLFSSQTKHFPSILMILSVSYMSTYRLQSTLTPWYNFINNSITFQCVTSAVAIRNMVKTQVWYERKGFSRNRTLYVISDLYKIIARYNLSLIRDGASSDSSSKHFMSHCYLLQSECLVVHFSWQYSFNALMRASPD